MAGIISEGRSQGTKLADGPEESVEKSNKSDLAEQGSAQVFYAWIHGGVEKVFNR